MAQAKPSLSSLEMTAIGAVSGTLEVCVMQPTVAVKNAIQEGRAIPRTPGGLYRGLLVSSHLIHILCGAGSLSVIDRAASLPAAPVAHGPGCKLNHHISHHASAIIHQWARATVRGRVRGLLQRHARWTSLRTASRLCASVSNQRPCRVWFREL